MVLKILLIKSNDHDHEHDVDDIEEKIREEWIGEIKMKKMNGLYEHLEMVKS